MARSISSIGAVFLIVLINTCLETVIHAEEEKLVERTGEVNRIEFVGNSAYTTEQLRTALRMNTAVTVAGRPEGDRESFILTIEHIMAAGYAQGGYARALVAAAYEEPRDCVVVKIEEGAKYTCGRIIVTGAKTLPVDQFCKEFTVERVERRQGREDLPIPPDLPLKAAEVRKPMWVAGNTAVCSMATWHMRLPSIRKIFESLGYFAPEFSVDVEPEEDQTVTLIVKIRNEGPRSMLDQVAIVGIPDDRIADVVTYLDLPTGGLLDSKLIADVERKLWNAARYHRYYVEAIPPTKESLEQKSTLKITLTEIPNAPPLTEPLTEGEQAVTRLLHWLTKFADAEEDLEISIREPLGLDNDEDLIGDVRLIVSAQSKGLIGFCRIGKAGHAPLLDCVVIMTPDQFTVDSAAEQLRFVAKDLGFRISLMLYSKSRIETGDINDALNFGANYNFGRRAGSPPLEMRATLPPAMAVSLFDRDDVDVEFVDSLAKLTIGDMKLSFDRQSGVLNQCSFDDDEDIKIMCARGLYRDALQKHETAMANAEVFEAQDRPITNFARFLFSYLQKSEDVDLAALGRVGRRIIAHDGLRGFDEIIAQYDQYENHEQFHIPDLLITDIMKSHPFWLDWTVPLFDAFLPKAAWTPTVAREIVFTKSMREYRSSRSFNEDLARGKIGPFTQMAIEKVLKFYDIGTPKVLWEAGAEAVTEQGFQVDCDTLLTDNWPLGRLILATAAAFQESDNDEVASFAKLLIQDEDLQPLANSFLRSLKDLKQKSPKEALEIALKEQWEPVLKPYLVAYFNDKEEPAKPSIPWEPLGPNKEFEETGIPPSPK